MPTADDPSGAGPRPRPRRSRSKDKPPGGNRQTGYPTVTKNRLFAGLILGVCGFAFLALVILTLLAFFGKEPPTQHQTKLADVCYFIITTTIGALVGLMGGRAATPDTLDLGDKRRP